MIDLILTREFPPQDGGISTVAFEMAKHWSSQGKKIEVLCWDYKREKWPGKFSDQTCAFPIHRISQPSSRFLQILTLINELFKIHRRKPIRRIWATSWNFSGLACSIFNFFISVPYAVLTHGYEVSKPALAWSDQWLLKVAVSRASKIFSVSRYTRDQLLKIVPGIRSVEFVPNGIDAQKYNPEHPQAFGIRKRFHLEDKKVLLTVARLFPRKGHDQVLKALSQIVKRIPDVHYLIVGEGPEKNNLKKMTQDLGLQNFVTFAGFIQDEDLAACYAACDLFILPNRVIDDPKDPWVGDFEGFGVVFVEASAAGKPIIAGNTGGAPDAVIDGISGFLVDPTATHQIAKKIIELLENPAFAHKIGRQGRERVERELHWPLVLQKYERAFL